jgi:hypothetical protein
VTEAFLPPGIPVALRPKLASVLGSLSTFARLLKVQDKESKKLIPFKPSRCRASSSRRSRLGTSGSSS